VSIRLVARRFLPLPASPEDRGGVFDYKILSLPLGRDVGAATTERVEI